jgi:hypothetical protein
MGTGVLTAVALAACGASDDSALEVAMEEDVLSEDALGEDALAELKARKPRKPREEPPPAPTEPPATPASIGGGQFRFYVLSA